MLDIVTSPLSFSISYIHSRLPPQSTLFPYTTLFRSTQKQLQALEQRSREKALLSSVPFANPPEVHSGGHAAQEGLDRKSTRLNSSHRTISYAVFCLKKKKRPRRL